MLTNDGMINIAICDDEKIVAKEIEELIKSIVNPEIYNTKIFFDGNDLLNSDYSRFDVVFLDIELGEVSGIDIATKIRGVNERAIIFFITNHFRYISEALKSMPFQYILKPICEKKELFFEEFNRGIDRLKKSKHTIQINTQQGEESIRVDSINYIEYLNKNVIIHTNKKEVKFIGKLNEWRDKLLPYDFVQCHKSFLVNLKYIENVKFSEIIMEYNTKIPIGRKYSHNFIETRNKFLLGIIV